MGHEIMVSATPIVHLDKTVLCLLVREQMRTLLNMCGVPTYHTSRPCELRRYIACVHTDRNHYLGTGSSTREDRIALHWRLLPHSPGWSQSETTCANARWKAEEVEEVRVLPG